MISWVPDNDSQPIKSLFQSNNNESMRSAIFALFILLTRPRFGRKID